MSDFACEHCGAICHDTPTGYVTGCEHYPPDAPNWAIEHWEWEQSKEDEA